MMPRSIQWQWRVALLLALCVSSSYADEVPGGSDISVSQIMSFWETASSRPGAVKISWTTGLNDGATRFSQYASQWASPESSAIESIENTLHLDDDRFQLRSVGFPPPEHGELTPKQRQQVPQIVRTDLSDRFEEDWLYNRTHFFIHEGVELRSLRPFIRTRDGETLNDLWPAMDGLPPRALIQSEHGDDWDDWMHGPANSDVAGRISLLDNIAALVAVEPGRYSGVRADDHWKVGGTRSLGARDCVVMENRPDSPEQPFRSIWVSPDQDMRIARLLNRSSNRITQIDISYAHDQERGWLPKEWTVVESVSPSDAIQNFLTSIVNEIQPAEALDPKGLAAQFPPGCWVVNRKTGENYILREDGTRRDVTAEELLWFPTYDELLATESGSVSKTIQASIERRQLLQKLKLPGTLAGVILGLGVTMWFLRRRRKSREPAAGDVPTAITTAAISVDAVGQRE